jgi:hypothetical protein
MYFVILVLAQTNYRISRMSAVSQELSKLSRRHHDENWWIRLSLSLLAAELIVAMPIVAFMGRVIAFLALRGAHNMVITDGMYFCMSRFPVATATVVMTIMVDVC